MPSVTHQTLVSLFRDHPALGLRLLESAGQVSLPAGAQARLHQASGRIPGRGWQVSLPAGAQARLHAAQLTDLRPPEYAADAASLIEDEDGQVLGAVVVEVQLSPDESKPPSWLSYTARLHRALLVPVTILAIVITEEMERWCARPYRYDHLGSTFRPLVIGPSAIPRIIDVEQARAQPELALLSVAAHGREPGSEAIGIAAYLATGTLDTDEGARYADVIMMWLSDAARRAVEEHMSLHGYEYQSEYARKYVDQGRKEILLTAIQALAEVLSIELSADQREMLDNASVERLKAIHEALHSTRQWPAD